MESPNIINLLTQIFNGTAFAEFLRTWENAILSLMVVVLISLVFYLASRRMSVMPGRFQAAIELIIGGIDEFVCGILGHNGRKYLPFIGTLFIYILISNLLGFIPFMKSPTSSLSMTFALSICVFLYVQYTAIKEMGARGYTDHLMGNPRGAIAISVIMPLFMFMLHLITEFIRPVTLALRLRSNVFGDEMLLSVIAGLGMGWLPLLFFSMLLAIIGAIMQAIVFSLLTTVYFALVLKEEEKER